MDTICLRSKNIPAVKLTKIINVIKKDGLVIIPTDTVYGLAGSAYSATAIEKIYKIKQRLKDKPLIIFVPNDNYLKKLKLKTTPKIRKLINVFWPGAVTFVFKKSGNGLSRQMGNKIAVRIPGHPVVLAILKGFNGPLVVTSANISGKESPFGFNQIDDGILGKIDIAINAGRCKFSVISTIVDISERKLKILREGAVPSEKILKVWDSMDRMRRN